MENYKFSYNTAKSFLNFLESENIYVSIARSYPWGELDTPPLGIQDSNYNELEDYRDIIFSKKVSNFSLVIRNIPWEERVFDQWNDRDPLIPKKDFYCITDARNVYKCISNNNSSVSIEKPSNVSSEVFQTSDGYLWKYMFTVPGDDFLAFSTTDWIPVREINSPVPGFELQYSSQISSIPGTIDRIDIVQGGLGYKQDTQVIIEGDGQDAEASLEIHPITGEILKVNMVKTGKNYTWARVKFLDTSTNPGSGAFAYPVLSPRKGHGHNPAKELYARDVAVFCLIERDENNSIKDDLNYRKVLMLVNPKLKNNNQNFIGLRINNTIEVTLDNFNGTFLLNEKIETSGGGEGYITYIDNNNSKLFLTGVKGNISGVLIGKNSSAQGNVTNVVDNSFSFSDSIIFRSYFDVKIKEKESMVEIKPIFRF